MRSIYNKKIYRVVFTGGEYGVYMKYTFDSSRLEYRFLTAFWHSQRIERLYYA